MCDMQGVTGRDSQSWADKPVCLYASFFFHASITIMATVCRFFPSHLVGETSAGWGGPTPALYPKRQTGLSIAYSFGNGVRALHCSMPVSSPIRPMASKFENNSLSQVQRLS